MHNQHGNQSGNGLEVQRLGTVRTSTKVTLQELKDVVSETDLHLVLPRQNKAVGCRGYAPFSLFLGFILFLRERYYHATTLEDRLKENPTFQEFCGFTAGKIPSHDTFSRFFQKLTEPRLRRIFHHLDNRLASLGVFDQDDLALDATDILSNGRNRHNLDPDAGWGYKSDKEAFHGYWGLLLVGTVSEFPRDLEVTPANVHQSVTGQKMLKRLTPTHKHNAVLFFADAAFDDKKTYHQVIEQEMVPLISYNPRRSSTKQFLDLKRSNWRHRSLGVEGLAIWQETRGQRSGVERYNATFKEFLAGRQVPVRGLDLVTRYVLGVTILSQLYTFATITRKLDCSISYQHSLTDFLSPIHSPWEGGSQISQAMNA